MRILPLAFGAIVLLAGCGTPSTSRKVMALDPFQKIFVVQALNDNHHLDELLVAELRRHGREASSGPKTMMPEHTDAMLTYSDRWVWDFKTYLIELNLELHTARTEKKLADAHYYHPSMRSEKPDDVIRDLLAPWFAK